MRESVRPAVSVYGRTSWGSSVSSRSQSSIGRSRVLRGASCGLDHGAHAFHQNGHLVTNLADVAVSGRQRRKVGTVADAHQQQIAVLHLRSEEHTSELQSRSDLVCRLLL